MPLHVMEQPPRFFALAKMIFVIYFLGPPKLHPDITLNNPYYKIVGERLKLPCKVTGNPKPF
jgi:hypothetical protein